MINIRFVSILFLFATLVGAEKDTLLEPDALKPQWWESFNESPVPLKTKAQDFVTHIQAILPQMTDAKKAEATEILERIQLNFNAYERAQQAAPLAIPPTSPASETYPVAEVLEIVRKAQSDTLVLKSLKDEQHDRLSQIDAVQEQLDRLAKSYFRSNERSEERFIAGLKLINYQVSLLAAKEDLARIDKGVAGYEIYIKKLNEEVDLAEHRLVSSTDEIAKLEKDREDALNLWKAASLELNQKEAGQIEESNRQTEKSSPSYQLVDQQFIQASIAEMLAHQHYLSIEIQLALAKILVTPDDIDGGLYAKKSREWYRSLNEIKRRSSSFASNIQRQIQRTGQLLSLSPQGEKDSAAIMNIQQQIIGLAQSNLLALQRLDSDISDSLFLVDQLDTRVTNLIGGSKRLTQFIGNYFSSFWATISDWIDTPLFHIGTKPVQLSTLLKTALIMLLTIWISQWAVDSINHFAIKRKHIDKSVLYRITRLLYYLLLGVGVVLALTTLGFDFSSFLLIAGALGVGLGFGLQTIFNNFFSGLILLFESQIKVGDFIEIASGVKGEVREINVRSTLISMADGLDAIVPNSEMISTRVVNWTLTHPYRRVKIPFTVAYNSDKELVRKIIADASLKVPETLIKPGFADPAVLMTAFGPTGLDFELHIWVNEKYSKLAGKTTSDYLWMIESVLKEHNIEIPFPRTEIRMLP